MKRFGWLPFFVGLVLGVLLTLVAAAGLAPGLMIREHASPFALDETVRKIEEAALAKGWVVSSVMELDQSVKKHGGPDVLPVRLVNLCKADYSGAILLDDDARRVSVMMPCTIAAYEKRDGKTYLGVMNAGLLGRLFGGIVAGVMGGPVAREQAEFVGFALP